MAKKKTRILKSKDSVKQVIPKSTLDKLAGDGKEFSVNQKKQIGRELVKKMRERTSKHKDIKGDDFASYGSASTREEDERFEYLRRKEKQLGKKISPDKVDLVLFKKLLKSIKVKVNDDGDLEIYHQGKKNNLKAYAHTSGERPKGVPKREYFGVRSGDIRDVASGYDGQDSEDE